MPATYVTVAELRSNLGIGSLYSDSLIEEICQSSEDIIKSKLWFNKYNLVAHSNVGNVGTLYTDVVHDLYVGQTVNISGAGSHFNGNKTIIAVTPYTFNVTTSHVTDTPKHRFVPYAVASLTTYTDFATVPEIREAAMMIAVDIFQARTMSSTGGVSPDFTPSPYKMGNTLLARVRSLIADYLHPGGLVG